MLHDCQIDAKIITGDSLFVAVDVGYQAGILAEPSVFLLEGNKF